MKPSNAVLSLGVALALTACNTSNQNPDHSVLDPTPHASPVQDGVQFLEGEVIVKFKNETAPASVVPTSLGLIADRELSDGATLYRVDASGLAPNANALELVAQLRARNDVEYAQPNYLYFPMAVPNDPQYPSQWHYNTMNLPAAWDITTGANSPVVAVIDTGKTAHPDLVGRWVGGYDFISSRSVAGDKNGRDSDPTDVGDAATCNGVARPSSWHGTHVAGTIGASTNNSVGVAGVNWNARILPVRVLGKCGGSTADIIDAIRWSGGIAVSGVPTNTNPAKVINMSLGGSLGAGATCATSDTATQNAINDVTARGVVVVVAAGNSNADTKQFTPASCNNTVTVAALDRNNKRSYYSNYGAYIDVAAPGGDTRNDGNGDGIANDGVLSTLLNSTGSAYTYAYYQGTSMATPHVAGLVSLMLAQTPTLTPAQVLTKLTSTATPLTATQCPEGCGAGLVNALGAVQ